MTTNPNTIDLTLLLTRIVTPEQRAAIAEFGPTWDAEEITVLDVVNAGTKIGYGGHYDETDDEEDRMLDIVARDGDEMLRLLMFRYKMTKAMRDAADALKVEMVVEID